MEMIHEDNGIRLPREQFIHDLAALGPRDDGLLAGPGSNDPSANGIVKFFYKSG